METVHPIKEIKKVNAFELFLRRASYRNYFMFVLGINVALRISDLLNLKVKDVKGKKYLKVREVKNNNDKIQLLSLEIRQIISDYVEGMKDDDYLFPSQRGEKPISRVQAYRILNHAAKALGFTELSIGAHTLRKTFGYHFYQKTKDLGLLQEFFGHSSIETTKRYIGLMQEEMDRETENFFIGSRL